MTLELVPPVSTEGPPLVGQLTIGALLGLVVAGALLVIIVLLMLLAAAMWYQRRSRKKKGPTILSNDFEFENMGVVRAPLIFPNVVTISPTIFIHASYNSLTLLPYPLSFLQHHLCLQCHYIITVSSLYPSYILFLHHSYIILTSFYIIPTSFLHHSYSILTSFLHHSYIVPTLSVHHSYIVPTQEKIPLPGDSVDVLLPLTVQKGKHFAEKFSTEDSTTFWYQDEKGIVSYSTVNHITTPYT